MLTPSRSLSDSAGGIPRNCLKDALRPQKPYILDRIWRNGAARWNAAPQGRIDSKRNPLLVSQTFGTRATQVRAPGPGENGPSPFPQNISPIASGALPKPTGRSPRSSAGDPRAICTRTPCPRATVNRPNGSSSIVPTQQVDAHIRLAGIEGRRTPRAGGRRGCRRKRPGVQPGL